MNVQNIIVFLIVAAACLYIGGLVWGKVKSLSAKSSSCGTNCGCGDGKSTAKKSISAAQKS